MRASEMSEIPKKRKPPGRRYCAHGLCTSNNIDKVDGVKNIPFPKPCNLYISSLHDASLKHSGKQCDKCSKCFRWMHLCKHADQKLQRLCDINRRTFICSKHFANGLGPSEMDPDPYPATMGQETRNTRPGPKPRNKQPPLKKHRKSTSISGPAVEEPIPKEPNTEDKTAGGKYISEIDNAPNHSITTDHGLGLEVCSKSPEVDVLSFLKSLAYSMVDNGIVFGFDQDVLTCYFFQGQILEKTCVINREFKIEIYVLGRHIPDSHKFWQKHMKIWDMKIDWYLDFLRDLSENWLVCRTSIESDNLQKLRERSCKSDSYDFDALTGTIRSRNCDLLATEGVCLNCCKMLQNIRLRNRRQRQVVSCRKISLMAREEAQKRLRISKIQLTYEKQKSLRHAERIKKLVEGHV